MQAINKDATEIMNQLIEGLNAENSHKKIDNRPGCYMAAVVEQIGTTTSGPLFSVAHYFTQNGDAMRDPEIIFIHSQDNKFYPVSFLQDSAGIYQEVVDFDDSMTPQLLDLSVQRQIAGFANTWMLNIQQQQNI